MVHTINETNRPVAVLNLPKKSVHGLITFATRVVKAMTANPAFTVPEPALAPVMAAVVDLRDADAKVAERIRYRPVLKAGAGDWSAPVTFTVK